MYKNNSLAVNGSLAIKAPLFADKTLDDSPTVISSHIIEVSHIKKHYKEKIACKDINFKVHAGEFLSIVGESGSGKSTLVKMISNLETKTSGEILYNGEDITLYKGKVLRNHRKDIQLVFQDTTSSLSPKMNILNIITEPLINFKLIKRSERKEVALEFLKKVELDETYLYKKPDQLSGGQRQRISIAKALTLNPKVLILDEPTSALDVITQSKILELLKTLQKKNNLTILFVCHDIALVTKISDRIIVMKDGDIKEILNTNNLSVDNFNSYTKKLVDSVFDVKKCGCRFDVDCDHLI